MITTCKKCGSKNLFLEPRIKGQDVMTADMVALKCKDCGAWLKWCPKNERKYYYHNTLKKDKWQILKEFVVNRIYYAGYDIQEHGSRVLTDIIDKMQELEGEDE